jgi:hypothetical protein
MWTGSLAEIPSGWALCDGSEGTPDLRNRFIRGTAAGEDPGSVGGGSSHTHVVDPPALITGTVSSTVSAEPGGLSIPCLMHTHNLDLAPFSSGAATTLPPYTKVAFIMKKYPTGVAEGDVADVAMGQPVMDPIVPNPFNPSAVIRFELPLPADVELAIYDARGRRVRTLVSSKLDVGRHDVKWDGRTDSGEAVASGVYLAKMASYGRTITRKMTLVR